MVKLNKKEAEINYKSHIYKLEILFNPIFLPRGAENLPHSACKQSQIYR
jgi:hypothetical protein